MIYRFKEFAAQHDQIDAIELTRNGRKHALELTMKSSGFCTEIPCSKAAGEAALKAFEMMGKPYPNTADLVSQEIDITSIAAILHYAPDDEDTRRIVVIMKAGNAFELNLGLKEALTLQKRFHVYNQG